MATHTETMEAPALSSAYEMSSISSPPQGNAKMGDNLASIELGNTSNSLTPSSSDFARALPRWNSSALIKYRTFATFWSFLIVGMNDGSYGAMIPLLESYYELNHTVVSLVFLSPFAGYAAAASVNNLMHVHFGQRGVAVVAPLCHMIPYLIFSFHPPYPVLVVMFLFIGMGNGLADAAWCSFIGQMANSHQVSGVLQACYALGATIAPLIATALAADGQPGWFSFYYVMTAASAVELITSAFSFWSQTGAVYLAENPMDSGAKSGRTRMALKSKLTWIFSIFIFGYCGAEVALGGWIVVFMTRVRGASALSGSAAASGFWGGMTVGRLFLSFITVRLGEFWAMMLYLGLTIVFELVFWLVPNMIASAVAAALIGLVMGPMFPTAVVLITKVLPRSLHVGTIGFATAFGGSGGAILPFAVGAIAQAKGVKTLQPIILAICVALAALWLLIPRGSPGTKKSDAAETSGQGTPLDS